MVGLGLPLVSNWRSKDPSMSNMETSMGSRTMSGLVRPCGPAWQGSGRISDRAVQVGHIVVTYNIVLTILTQEVEHEEDLQSLREDLSLMLRR
jgi:hypothetical protein